MITTKRLTLRPIELKDSKDVYSYRSDAETNKYQGWSPKSINEIEEFISKNPKEFNKPTTWFQFVISENDSQTIIGDVGIHFIDKDQCELGITLAKNNHGKGFATESLKGVIDYLFNSLHKHRIITSIDPRNVASIKLVEALGLRKEAHFKKSLFFKGEWVDDIIYATLKKEWK
ncbi:GNAT family N-acetyltransferase [Polaribacter sp. Hel1_85]|uniref:GNAT family N-acetyltransferase n=1 Tax=Polaribacter sp. Hel1_85 TaxID=1250005 RepID=UPI00052D59F0|nr:GNAT family protein [Polaribacter sp. Hel1_85]KGL58600.1 N-acetyltransferase GCN5 [Polaribacter sp. Hel1_85]